MAISVYNKSKKAYRHLRAVGLVPVPCENRLRQIEATNKVNSGSCSQLYERARARYGSSPLYGQLVADEMNVTCSIVWNSVTHDIWGFVDDELTLDGIVTNALSKEKEDKSTAKKVNQWLFRSWSNKTFLCEFWFNNGNLDGKGMLVQFEQVLRHCEMKDFRVHGVCIDAGGSNHGFFSLLRSRSIAGDHRTMYDDEHVSMIHPLDSSRKIFLWYCMTHIMKAVRNQHNKSLDSGTRNLLDESGKSISWEVVREILRRDKAREQRGCKRYSKLTDNAVFPDGWLSMMVSICKAVYSYETLAELLEYILDTLSLDMPVPSKDEVATWMCLPGQNLKIGQFSFFAEFLKTEDWPSEKGRNPIPTLQFMVCIHELFNCCFMNKQMNINRENIDKVYRFVEHRLNKIGIWHQAAMDRRSTDKGWEKTFMSSITWGNLRASIVGFLGYSKYMLGRYSEIRFICALSANTSVIESIFAEQRAMGNENPQRFTKGILMIDLSKAYHSLDTTKTYDSIDAQTDNMGKELDPASAIKIEKEIQTWIKEWSEVVHENIIDT